jgi:hypothetical protein
VNDLAGKSATQATARRMRKFIGVRRFGLQRALRDCIQRSLALVVGVINEVKSS